MSVSGIGGSSGFDLTQMASKFFKKADSNNDGGIDKTELKTMLASGPGGTKVSKDIDKVFAEVDTDSDGTISEDENSAQMKKMSSRGGAPSVAGAAKGPPPSGGGGAQVSSSGKSTNDSTKTYDQKDSNKDGTVSNQEELAYSIEHPEDSENDSSGVQKDVGYSRSGNISATENIYSKFDMSA